ncbi:MAG: DUF2231 domain-containing protein [Phycisphaerae bacterium]
MSRAWVLLAPGVAEGESVASMWRIELLHPMVVHAPIALTLVGTVFWAAGLAGGRWKKLRRFALPATVLLLLAAAGSWLSVLTGHWADDVVGRSLYDPRVLKDHENVSEAVSWVLGGAVVVELARYLPAVKGLWQAMATVLAAGLLLTACGLMAWTAHLGASLVYQQGAGVIMPGPAR